SLANNGTHISLGSLKLTRYRHDRRSGFAEGSEKCLGDLVIKLVEHFLPLFVGTYSAAPYRLDFAGFHPELVLGFLPHELDYTHLRMIWRRWKKKASLRILGTPITPFGLARLDGFLSTVFRMKGDLVPDFRLIDYPVSLMSTERSPALDGIPGNDERLKRDLAALGVFDARMPLYMFYRLREYSRVGFSGFEGRQYSVFEGLLSDAGNAINLQVLINALAFSYALGGKWTHADIPDDPLLESERRQICFCAAAGIPTFYVRENTRNLFLKRIIACTPRVRHSRRYPGYLRVYVRDYCLTLAAVLRSDAAGLIDAFGMHETFTDLGTRLEDPENGSAAGRLISATADQLGTKNPLKVRARDFNSAAERYYRTVLRGKHLSEALDVLVEDIEHIRASSVRTNSWCRAALQECHPDGDPAVFAARMRRELGKGRVGPADLVRMVHLLLISIHFDSMQANETPR
ncbi:MAG: hypothetical protein V2B18_21960, partial [Pseudomonadota bacterium]